jgi:N-acetylneuraminic acid mutarotase
MPGSRALAATWTDTNGNFWLFGGLGFDAVGVYASLNDLWEFNPTVQEWTWMGGSTTVGADAAPAGVYGTLGASGASNMPGGRNGALTWTDASGNFWLFGGEGSDASGNFGWLNDLWKFSPSTKEWVWISGDNVINQFGIYGTKAQAGAANIPGGRQSGVSFIDSSGNLWLFGGEGYDATGNWGYLNDLWKFNPTTGQWTWMSGSNILQNLADPGIAYGQIGTYGTLGIPAPDNVPGTRVSAAGWADSSGHLWVFGGWGFDWRGFRGYLNDFWEFDPSTSEWSWMGGSDSNGQDGTYGTKGTSAIGNIPGARSGASTSIDGGGNFWFFSGSGMGAATIGYPNDVWEFTPTTKEWAWMGGDSAGDPTGDYGMLGVPSASSAPPGRSGAAIWFDGSGNVWMFGGQSFATSLNDVWEFERFPGNLSVAATPSFSPAGGKYATDQTVTLSESTAGASIKYSIDGDTPATYTGPIAVSSTETIQAIAEAPGYINSGVASATYTISIPPTFALGLTPNAVTVSSGKPQTINLTVTPQNGFNSTVNFACSGLPAGASCTFNPGTVTTSGAPATSQLTISANAQSARLPFSSGPFLPALTLAATFCFFGWTRHAGLKTFLLAASIIWISLTLGCGGSGGAGGDSTLPETATVTITATAGNLQQTATLALTVNY